MFRSVLCIALIYLALSVAWYVLCKGGKPTRRG